MRRFAAWVVGGGMAVTALNAWAQPGHELAQTALYWHGRLMVLGWSIAIPLGVLIARFFKVLPTQNWPRELDNQFWWQSHLWLQSSGVLLVLLGLAATLAFDAASGGVAAATHSALGYAIVMLAALQVLGGLLRGSKGGPGVPGDHYDMTARRRLFEAVHKSTGYMALLLALPTTMLGLRLAHAPVWMWAVVCSWWGTLLVVFIVLQRQGRCVDTHAAIWGPGHGA